MNLRPLVLNFSKVLAGFRQYDLAEGSSLDTVFSHEGDAKLGLDHGRYRDVLRITSTVLF